MIHPIAFMTGLGVLPLVLAARQDRPETDVLKTPAGDLTIGFVGHASLFFLFGGKTVHIDPVFSEGDYASLPKADLILVTHEHFDHLDPRAVSVLRKPGTEIVASAAAAAKLPGAAALRNGETRTVQGIPVRAVPAYNVTGMRSPGVPFHPKGAGNGYVLDFGGFHVYVAGDTENVPEVLAVQGVDAAFLPMDLPYTMSPEMVAAAARAIRPRILYPYHTGDTDTARLAALLKDEPGIAIRIRRMR